MNLVFMEKRKSIKKLRCIALFFDVTLLTLNKQNAEYELSCKQHMNMY